MLRVRSGEGQADKPPAIDETALAELGAVVDDAQNEIKRLVQLGELQNDPIRHPIQALSVHLDALHKITRAGSQMLAKQLQMATQKIDPGPAREEDLRRAVIEGITTYSQGAHNLSLRSAAVCAVLLLVALLAGARAGYWFGQSSATAQFVQVPSALGVALTGPDATQWVNLMRLNDIDKAERVCSARAGGVACTISLWVKPPTAKAEQASR